MTRAVSNQPLIDVSKQIHKTNMLMFGADSKITVAVFDIIDQQVTHWSEAKVEKREIINFAEIANACILYQIAQREGQAVGCGTFDMGVAERSIKNNIADHITNKEDVVYEIYNSWNSLAKKTEFIKNVSEGRVRVDRSMAVKSMTQPLTPIPNFPQFIEGLIHAYINTVANEENIQLWSLEQTIELFLSTFTGCGFNHADRARSFFVLDTQIAQCLNKPNANKDKLIALRERLKAQNGEWLASLNGYVGNELSVLFMEQGYLPATMKAALENLCLGEFTKLDTNPGLKNDLQPLQNLLQATADSIEYNSMIQRDRNNRLPVPNIELFRIAIIAAISKEARAAQIELELTNDMSDDKILQNVIGTAPIDYSFDDFINAVNALVAPYGLNTRNTDICEHTFLRLAGIDVIPRNAQVGASQKMPQFFYFDLGIKPEVAKQFATSINEKFRVKLAEYTSEHNQITSVAIRMNTNLVMKHVMAAAFKTQIEKDLGNQLILQNYRAIMRGEAIAFSTIVAAAGNLGNAYELTTKSDFFETSILQGFGIDASLLGGARFFPAVRATGFALDTDFYLGIDSVNALQLAININREFPESAILIATNVNVPDKGDGLFQHIAIRNSVLISTSFLDKLRAGLKHIAEHNFDVLEKLEMQCDKRRFTTKSLVQDLNTVAEKYAVQDATLANAIAFFAMDLNLHKPKQECMLSSFNLQKAIALHESQAESIEALTSFKADKTKIKSIQRETGARPKKLF